MPMYRELGDVCQSVHFVPEREVRPRAGLYMLDLSGYEAAQDDQ